MAKPFEVTDANFDSEVLKADKPVLVDFWAPWCGPCLSIAPYLDRVAGEFAGRVKIAKLNVDENPVIANAFGIRSIPTIGLFMGGDAVDGVMGAVPKQAFAAMLDKHLAVAKAG